MNLNSSDVIAFPCTKRADTYLRDKVVSEVALTRVIKLLSPDHEGTFLITENLYGATKLEFCIKGYYFSIPLSGYSSLGSSSLYASIATTTPTSGDYTWLTELEGDSTGSTSTFQGLVLSNTSTTGSVLLGNLTSGTITTLNNSLKLSTLLKSVINIDTTPYVASSSEPSNKTKLWIDTSNSSAPLLNYYNGSAWVKLGAVFK